MNIVHLWGAMTGEHKEAFTGHTRGVQSLAFSPDGGTLASGELGRRPSVCGMSLQVNTRRSSPSIRGLSGALRSARMGERW